MPRLTKYLKRRSPVTGKRYPQCQHHDGYKQCRGIVYSNGLCFEHFQTRDKKQCGY